ncbi:MAG: phosphate ABC transporter permease subunit PstC [Verrucomicrobiae bacterium]|nr:phosphate ABC transporter permease subunit PstC [Verrucomicrobiae bacterium]
MEKKLAEARKLEQELAPEWKSEAEAALDDPTIWDLDRNPVRLNTEEKVKIREAVLMAEPAREQDHPYFVALRESSAAKKEKARAKYETFKATIDELRNAVKPVRDLHGELRDVAMENRRVLDKFETAPARKKALIEGAEATKDPEEKARKLKMAEAVVMDTPDYEALNKPIYDSVPKYEEIEPTFVSGVTKAWEALPDPKTLETKSGREKLRAAKASYEDFLKSAENSSEKIPKWRHDKPMSVLKTVLAFFFGKDWITNSSWHEFYGLLPLFSGSLLISLIAIVVSVPFSVAAAVYVNQLARSQEQNFIKPALEFIQAIPSIVLGFFGILVLGTALRNLSHVEWLSWVPGFPMSERLNMLTAGLLLAFMAVPTIFTLAEDALNNVPRSFSEASFALGASKLQTIFKVVMPTAISGIVAAVLLGFGRIIGETMVVLLVAGNKIQIPDFTAGIGVFTQPAHTMTGIIAQELGEVEQGSLHWRALFMVGMVLFCISLLINYFAQRILKKFHHAH